MNLIQKKLHAMKIFSKINRVLKLKSTAYYFPTYLLDFSNKLPGNSHFSNKLPGNSHLKTWEASFYT
jgi:hypothetical protein